VALSGIGLVGLPLLVLMVFLYFLKRTQSKIINKIRNYVYYKLIIQYFKVAFINLVLQNLLTVAQWTDDDAVLVSAGLLVAMTAVLLLFFSILAFSTETYLERSRPQLGNLYSNLKTKRFERLYGFVWFIQRIALVACLVFIKPFFFQFAITTFCLLAKPVWFCFRQPYLQIEQGFSDFMNDIFLLFTHACMATWLTANVPEDATRYAFGWKYSYLIIACFALNLVVVTHSIIGQITQSANKKRRKREREKMLAEWHKAMEEKREKREKAHLEQWKEREMTHRMRMEQN
jgi:hypothetical protein